MDSYTLLWLQYLGHKIDLVDHKLDAVLRGQQSPDPQRLAELKGHIEAKAAELKAAVDAQRPKP